MSQSKIVSRILQTPEERKEFLLQLSDQGKKVQKAALHDQEIHGIYVQGSLKAGFAFESFPLSETLKELSAAEKAELIASYSKDIRKTRGLSCFWISKSGNTQQLINSTLSILVSVLVFKKWGIKHLVFSTRNEKLQALCERMKVEAIFRKKFTAVYCLRISWINFFRFLKLIFIRPAL